MGISMGLPSGKQTVRYGKSEVFIGTVATLKYVEGGPDREAPEVVWNTSS